MSRIVSVEKVWDGNVYEREGRNGRLYRGVTGWRWLVIVGGETRGDYDTKREAQAAIASLITEEHANG